MGKVNVYDLLEESGIGLPECMKIVNSRRVRIKVDGGWEGTKWHNITIKNVIAYYHKDARNISSGYRQLGSIGGDWRNIDHIAKECLELFKVINRGGLEKEGSKCGMTLKN